MKDLHDFDATADLALDVADVTALEQRIAASGTSLSVLMARAGTVRSTGSSALWSEKQGCSPTPHGMSASPVFSTRNRTSRAPAESR